MKIPLPTSLIIVLLCGISVNSAKSQMVREIKKIEISPDSKAIAFITMEGTKQGKFKGNVQGGQKSEIIDFNYSLSQSYDQASGQATGKIKHGALTVTMKNGPSTPQILQALSTNEVLKSVFIEFARTQPDGTSFIYYTVKLVNARITRVNQSAYTDQPSANHGGLPLDEISFVFQKIEIEQKDGNTMTVIDAGNF